MFFLQISLVSLSSEFQKTSFQRARNFDYAALDEDSELDDVVEMGRDAEERGRAEDVPVAL